MHSLCVSLSLPTRTRQPHTLYALSFPISRAGPFCRAPVLWPRCDRSCDWLLVSLYPLYIQLYTFCVGVCLSIGGVGSSFSQRGRHQLLPKVLRHRAVQEQSTMGNVCLVATGAVRTFNCCAVHLVLSWLAKITATFGSLGPRSIVRSVLRAVQNRRVCSFFLC